ncbi:Hsp70 family protein [Cryptosporangium sp. NPDC048952]|uniref:Hsp70 family protein n=1 Tax=Cryptosporangium sp. NPDC048952 TaxID=3363961 RepID=UPI003724C4B2
MPGLLGVDFGTTSTVAVVDVDGAAPVPLLIDGSPSFPSAVFLEPDGDLLAGQDALRAARGAPAAVEPYPKRCIDDGSVLLDGREVSVAELIGSVLARVRAEARRVLGGPPSQVRLTHPAAWGPRRTGILREAAAQAGLGEVLLIAEPVAAAAYAASKLGEDRTWLCYDLGGGTTDFTVVQGRTVLATGGLGDVGGLDIDQAIVEHLAVVLPRGNAEAWARLVGPETAAERRAGMAFRAEVRLAKEVLSRRSSTVLHVPLLEVEVPLGRELLDQIAEPVLARTLRGVRELLRSAPPIEGVLLVGGGCRMPLVSTLLHRELGLAPVLVEHPETVVALGSLLVKSSSETAVVISPAGDVSVASPPPDASAGYRAETPADPSGSPALSTPKRWLGDHSVLRRRTLAFGGIATTVVVLLAVALAGVWNSNDGGQPSPRARGPLISGAATFERIGRFGSPGETVRASYLSPGAARVLVSGDNGQVWSGLLSTGSWQPLPSGSAAPVVTVVFSPDKDESAAGLRADGTLDHWNLATGARGSPVQKGRRSDRAAVSRDAAVVAWRGRQLRAWWPYIDTDTLRQLMVPAEVDAVAFHDDLLVVASRDGVLRVWDSVTTNSLVERLSARVGPVQAVALFTEYQRATVLAADQTGRVRCWIYGIPDDARPRLRHELALPGQPNEVVAEGNPSRSLTQVAAVAHGYPAAFVAISADGRYFATADTGGTLRIWLSENGKPIATVSGLTGLVGPLDFRLRHLYVTTATPAGVSTWRISPL